MNWVAVASAALDQRGLPDVVPGVETIVLPVIPSEPRGLAGEYSDLWLRLVDGPVSNDDLTEDEQAVVRDYADAGIASNDVDDPLRVTTLDKPWLSSPLHELAYGLISRLSAARGIDVVFIKGPALHRQGLRPNEHSGDIDVWVDAARVTELASLLEPWGWSHLNERWETSPLYHSVTMLPGRWGCEIDLHRHMPGFSTSDRESLQLLLSDAQTWNYAGVPTRVPSRHAHAVVGALHLMRPQQGRPVNPWNREQAITTLREGGSEALDFAKRVGAGPALGEVLTAAFPGEDDAVCGPVPLNWRWRAEPDRLKRYIIMFRATPLRSWPRMAFRSVWPETNIALRLDQLYGGTTKSPAKARLRRIVRGILQQLHLRD